ncbi:MAG: type IX secretion system outer membrane channel protein PorV [Bacteroidota bacterium]|nr:type IX secretion system outer membrane channel protein PorV [Bacteroidota bacterium]
MRYYVPVLLFTCLCYFGEAQIWDPVKKCVVDATNGTNGDCLSNTLLTAVPFLRITPDARSGALGDAGVSLTPDANALHHNAARLPFADQNLSISATLSPWLRNLGIDDIYLMYLTGFYKIDDNQVAGAAVRYFSLGEIEFRDDVGSSLGTGRPNEVEANFTYARKLSPIFSASLSAKFVYSNLASGRFVGASEITSAKSFGADIGVFYRNTLGSSGRRNYLNVGMAITNIGSKVTYIKELNKDFIPTNLGLGGTYEMNFDDYNSLSVTAEVNKLLVPSPIPFGNSAYDVDTNKVADFREKGLFEGIFGSFNDGVGGFSEELQEFTYSLGLEYWYDKQFAVRFGYFNEHALKGNRKFLTMGCGFKYNVFGLNLSYLVPTNTNRSPLANTLRFSLTYDFLPASAPTEN